MRGMMRVINSTKIQRGGQPDDFKPMALIGKGVEEIRVSGPSGAYGVIYVARRVGFSLDVLVNMATALGCRVRFDLEAA